MQMLQIQKIKKSILSRTVNFLIWFKEHRRKNAEWSKWQVNNYFEYKALEEKAK